VAGNVETAQRLGTGLDRTRAADLLAELGIAHRSAAHPSELSGGEAARAGLAVALANDPSVVLADEPTGELDSTTGDRVIDLLLDRAARGAAVVIVTHTDRIARRADRCVHLRDGRVDT
jgi:putative ABC transport system ATP-binding protein